MPNKPNIPIMINDNEIDLSSCIALSRQIEDIIIKEIRKGGLAKGGKLPAERQLSIRYGVSRGTLRKAILSLVKKGYLCHRVGKGTYIRNEFHKVQKGEINIGSKLIGFVVSDCRNPFFAELLYVVEKTVSKKGYSLMLFNSGVTREEEAKVLREAVNKGVKGIIIAPLQGNIDRSYIFSLQKDRFPIVFIGRRKGIDSDYVSNDDVLGAYQAVEHLLKLGHKRIGYLGGLAEMLVTQDCLRGYRDALIRNIIKFDKNLVKLNSISEEDNYRDVKELLTLSNRPTAIFLFSDRLIKGTLRAIEELNLKVPDDVAIIGYEEMTSKWGIPLSSVRQSFQEIGKITTKMLFKKIEQNLLTLEPVIIKPTLIIRESTDLNAKRK